MFSHVLQGPFKYIYIYICNIHIYRTIYILRILYINTYVAQAICLLKPGSGEIGAAIEWSPALHQGEQGGGPFKQDKGIYTKVQSMKKGYLVCAGCRTSWIWQERLQAQPRLPAINVGEPGNNRFLIYEGRLRGRCNGPLGTSRTKDQMAYQILQRGPTGSTTRSCR